MMTSMEYYKSIISDDEVIKALIRESKAREGTLFKQKTRVRPNLNFFQRTVSNLVSSNRRIKSRSEEFVSKVPKRYVDNVKRNEKTSRILMREILSNKINFVKASNRNDQDSSKEDIDCLIVDNEQTISNGSNKDEEMESDVKVSEHMEWGSRHLYLDSYKGGSGSGVSGSSKTASCTKRRRRKSSDSSDTSVVSISSSHSSSSSSSSDESVILVSSDSESDCNRSKEVKQSGENVKRRKKLKK